MRDSLTKNHHYELSDDTSSRPRCQNCPIPCRSIRHPQLSGSTKVCLKSNKESSTKYGPLPMLAYMVYDDFELSELVPISVLNTTPKIYLAHMFKNKTLYVV